MLDLDATVYEVFDGLEVAFLSSDVEGGIAVRVFYVDAGVVFDQEGVHLLVSKVDGEYERGRSWTSAVTVRISLVLQQYSHSLNTTTPCCPVDWLPINRYLLNISPFSYQISDYLRLVMITNKMKT